ncbi:hypothetical protein [Humidesulfovibrio idahonensis]
MPETKATRPAPQGQDTPSAVILHGYVEQTDGGSRLCLVLGRALGADFCCGFARPGHPFLAAPFPGKVRTLMPALPVPLARQWALALAFEHRTRFVQNYGTAVFSGAYASLRSAGPPSAAALLRRATVVWWRCIGDKN